MNGIAFITPSELTTKDQEEKFLPVFIKV